MTILTTMMIICCVAGTISSVAEWKPGDYKHNRHLVIRIIWIFNCLMWVINYIAVN